MSCKRLPSPRPTMMRYARTSAGAHDESASLGRLVTIVFGKAVLPAGSVGVYGREMVLASWRGRRLQDLDIHRHGAGAGRMVAAFGARNEDKQVS